MRLVPVVSVIFLVVLSTIPVLADTGSFNVVSGKTFQVNYNANGVTIQEMETNPTYDELTVTVQVSNPNSSLDLTIPRSLLDSKQGSNDIPFIVVVDGTLANTVEKNPTSSDRTVTIQLTPGNKQIEIIGTYVAMSGPSGSSTAQTLPTTGQPQTTQKPTNQTGGTTSTKPAPTPSTSQAPTTRAEQTTSPSAAVATNASQNVIIKIPYLQKVTVTLSAVDLTVISAIVLVIIIVVASAARRKPIRPARARP